MLQRPSFGVAEIAWRWSFGAASCLLLAFSFFEYLNTLPVTGGDLLLLKTRQPALVAKAMADIFRGSALRAVDAIVILVLALAIGWTVIASAARAATIKALLIYFRERENSSSQRRAGKSGLLSLFGLNFFRLVTALAAAVGSLAALLLGGMISPPDNPAPGSAFLVFLSVVLLVWLAWSAVNWFLSLAGVFVVAEGDNTFRAIASSVALCRERAGSVLAAGTWFGLAHVVAFVLATSVVAFPLGLARVLPAGVVLGGVLLVTLLYFGVVDFLYMGRLAAYVAILELPKNPVLAETSQPLISPAAPSRGAVDRNELILGDLPASS